MGRQSKFPSEVRERVVRLVFEQQGVHGSVAHGRLGIEGGEEVSRFMRADQGFAPPHGAEAARHPLLGHENE
jgi:hypothetical protein